MSLEEGAINYTDLSPNANIQGTQIADKTLRLRNLSDDTFGIAQSGTTTITVANPPVAGTNYISPTITHNLGYIPAFLAFVTPSVAYSAAHGGGANAEIPWLSIQQATISTVPLIYIYFIVDSDTITSTTINFYAQPASTDANYSGIWTVQYYLLRESFAS